MRLKTLARTAAILLTVMLSACASSSNPVVRTLQNIVGHDENDASSRLNPDFSYLRVIADGRVVYLALGYVDTDPHGHIEVWYSAEREVLRLQNGRIIGATGLPVEWRSVSLPVLPSWSAIARAEQPVRWLRSRDVMPGYRFGMKEEMVVRSISPPRRSDLQGMDSRSLAWFEEQAIPENAAGNSGYFLDKSLPPAQYAVDFHNGKETVVYGEQCLASDLCFTWQRWPVAAHAQTGKQ